MDTVQITWEVNDGYIGGGSRPQHTIIELYDIDSDASREQVQEIIEYWVSEDFKEKICPAISGKNIERAIDQIMEVLAKRKAEEEEDE